MRDPEVAKDKGIIRGTVKYAWGTVSGATVMVGERSAKSDGAGGYEIPGLTPGTYTVSAKAPFPGYEVSSLKVELAPRETKTVDVYLDFEKAVVEGHVYDQDGKPIPGATLSGLLSGKDMATATTDEQGYFKFDRVTPEDRFIRVNARGYAGEARDFKTNKEKATVLEFRLTPAACKVHGTVTDENGQPLRAELSLLGPGGVIVERTLSDAKTGYYEISVMPGTCTILPSAPGHETKPWEGSTSADTKVDFILGPCRIVDSQHRIPLEVLEESKDSLEARNKEVANKERHSE